MNLIDAIKLSKFVARPNPKFKGSNGDGFVCIDYALSSNFLKIEDILADDWQAKPEKKEVKRFWIWTCRNLNGGLIKEDEYMDDEGYMTCGTHAVRNEYRIKKHEDEFIDVEQ